MVNFVHRQGDSRSCGATTVAKSNRVRVNGRPISIEGDPNTHSGGALRASETVGKVRVNSIPVILLNDNASADALCPGPGHCNPKATSASPNVRAGGG
jgi:uncharacterized Zn-binding protein involved in type VI secretion